MTKEELQLRWDEILIQGRFFCMDTRLRNLEENFTYAYGKSPRDFGLLRVPLENYSYNSVTVLLFICEHLPKIAAFCWRHTSKDFERVVDCVNRSNNDTRINASSRYTRAVETADLSKTSRLMRQTKASKEISNANWDAQKSSNQWAVCK